LDYLTTRPVFNWELGPRQLHSHEADQSRGLAASDPLALRTGHTWQPWGASRDALTSRPKPGTIHAPGKSNGRTRCLQCAQATCPFLLATPASSGDTDPRDPSKGAPHRPFRASASCQRGGPTCGKHERENSGHGSRGGALGKHCCECFPASGKEQRLAQTRAPEERTTTNARDILSGRGVCHGVLPFSFFFFFCKHLSPSLSNIQIGPRRHWSVRTCSPPLERQNRL
jgi:hypothetical protein